jgi:hypothetical protein
LAEAQARELQQRESDVAALSAAADERDGVLEVLLRALGIAVRKRGGAQRSVCESRLRILLEVVFPRLVECLPRKLGRLVDLSAVEREVAENAVRLVAVGGPLGRRARGRARRGRPGGTGTSACSRRG